MCAKKEGDTTTAKKKKKVTPEKLGKGEAYHNCEGKVYPGKNFW